MEDKKHDVNRAVKLIAKLSIDKASQVFSKMIKAGASIEMERAYMADISDATAQIMSNYNEVAGAIIDLVGDAPFKFLFMITIEDSYLLTDLILRKEPGTTKDYNVYTESAVQEIGNILSSAITNVFSSDFQIALKPTPPVMVHDFAGAVFEEYIHEIAAEKDEVLMIESKFHAIQSDLRCHMFILPIKDSEKILTYMANTI